MTKTYDPYQNAVAERVNGISKQEFAVDKYDADIPILEKIIAESIQIYNRNRPHYSCHFKTPEQMYQRE